MRKYSEPHTAGVANFPAVLYQKKKKGCSLVRAENSPEFTMGITRASLQAFQGSAYELISMSIILYHCAVLATQAHRCVARRFLFLKVHEDALRAGETALGSPTNNLSRRLLGRSVPSQSWYGFNQMYLQRTSKRCG